MTKDEIKQLALANGFKLKEQADGSLDLNQYVYQFADALMQTSSSARTEMTEHEEQIAYFNELYAAAQLPETWVITDKNNNPTCEIDLKNYARIGFKFGLGYAREQASNRWISVYERLPEVGVPVLIYTPQLKTGSIVGMIDSDYVGGVWVFPDEDDSMQFKYGKFWQPLPEPPKEDE